MTSTPLPEQSKPFQPGYCARCAGMEPPKEQASKQSDLDEILAKHNGELGVTWEDPDVVTPDTKQAILRWVADEVVGEDSGCGFCGDSIQDEQREVLAQHGYKGGER